MSFYVGPARYISQPIPPKARCANCNIKTCRRGNTALEKSSARIAVGEMTDKLNARATPFHPIVANNGWQDPNRRQVYTENTPLPQHVPQTLSTSWASTQYSPEDYAYHAHHYHYTRNTQARAYYNAWAQWHGYAGPQDHDQWRNNMQPPVSENSTQVQFSHGYGRAYQFDVQRAQSALRANTANQSVRYTFDSCDESLQSQARSTDTEAVASISASKRTNEKKINESRADAQEGIIAGKLAIEEINASIKTLVSQIDSQVPKKMYGAQCRLEMADANLHATADKLNEASSDSKPDANRRVRKEAKILRKAPLVDAQYLICASGEPARHSTANPSGHMLVVLDLNGTVLYRPNKRSQRIISRPYLPQFLHYLFQHFKVMVWSSARPANVSLLVSRALTAEFQSRLVAQWGRDTLGLSQIDYNQNVQVYKDLSRVWGAQFIQSQHPAHPAGQRFGQYNTVLIDDSSTKAKAQPHNLIEIPEFTATPEQMAGDVLHEVVGYLEELRHHADVSRFMRKKPFKNNGTWSHKWHDTQAADVKMNEYPA